MKVLVIGDEHTYGYGLQTEQLSYLGHFVRQISRLGQSISVDAYPHLTLTQTVTVLNQLPLGQYDLIVLQADPTWCRVAPSALTPELSTGAVFLPGLHEPPKPAHRGIARQLMQFGSAVLTNYLNRLRQKSTGIEVLMNLLKPYRHTVIWLTPMPHRSATVQWVRRQVRATVRLATDRHSFSLFDTDQVIQPREEYFLSNNPEHLNAVSHELLGRALFDFYQSAPTIVTIQPFRRQGRSEDERKG